MPFSRFLSLSARAPRFDPSHEEANLRLADRLPYSNSNLRWLYLIRCLFLANFLATTLPAHLPNSVPGTNDRSHVELALIKYSPLRELHGSQTGSNIYFHLS